EEAQGVTTDLVEDSDVFRRRVQAGRRRVAAVEIEHLLDAIAGADQLGRDTRSVEIVLQREQQRGGASVERLHPREIEAHAPAIASDEPTHLRPGGVDLAESQLAIE